MDKLTLLCGSRKNQIEIYQCLCCGKLRIDYGPVSFTLNKDEFVKFIAVVEIAVGNQNVKSYGTISLRLGEHCMLRLTLEELHDFRLCLITAQETLEKEKRLLRPEQFYQDLILN